MLNYDIYRGYDYYSTPCKILIGISSKQELVKQSPNIQYMEVNLPVFPDGCGDCNGACCYFLPYGATPWTKKELEKLDEILPLEIAQKEREYRKNNMPDGIKITKSSPLWKCINLTEEGLCGLQIKNIEYKPMICRTYDIGDAFCIEARKKHGFKID